MKRKKLISIVLASVVLCAVFSSCASSTVSTGIMNENDLKALFCEKNDEEILEFVCHDFDSDGTMEAFIVTEKNDDDGKEIQSLWFISETEYLYIFDIGDFDRFSQLLVIEHEDSKHLAIGRSYIWPPACETHIWDIEGGKPNIVYSKDERAVTYINGILMATDTWIPLSGRVWDHYELVWDSDKEEYAESFLYTES